LTANPSASRQAAIAATEAGVADRRSVTIRHTTFAPCLRRHADNVPNVRTRAAAASRSNDPHRWEKRLARLRRPAWLGTIRRTSPLSDHWGRERGTPVDRYYIEHFLAGERHSIRGRVLEVMNAEYTGRFGTGVDASDVLDIDAANEAATIVADLAAADEIPSETFDCFILTQTLQYVYDVRAAVEHAHRILRPGGTLLATVPAVSRVARQHLDTEYWRFTAPACSRLFGDAFRGGTIDVRAPGNVLTAVAFLMGIAHEELSARELALNDPFFPVIVTVRATKAR
jgi:SAM-dependent methyltransferase